ncbi:MAG: response regulator [Acidobacteria bacterium]|nr:response regulator [Acidobacteriota bacterium]
MAALLETRQRFIAGFPARCDSICLLVDTVAALGPRGPVTALRQIVHRMTGLAGTVGFPTISDRSGQLEHMLTDPQLPGFEPVRARALVGEIRAAFAGDLAAPPFWVTPEAPPARAATILVVEDDAEQRELVVARLQDAGYAPIGVESGTDVLDAARTHHPALVLLDVNLPGLDGYSACRLLKADPDLTRTPIIFTTTRASLDDRIAAFTLGADEFLTKPIDLNELVVRVQHTLARRPDAGAAGPNSETPELDFEAFLAAARDLLRSAPAALAIMRLPVDGAVEAAAAIRQDLRRRDLVARYDDAHLMLLMPDLDPGTARSRLGHLVAELSARGIDGLHCGVVGSQVPGVPLESLMADADEALAAARGEQTAASSSPASKAPAAARPVTIVIAEDDPEVIRILEAQMRAARYEPRTVSDGEAALNAVCEHPPDVLILDLMMPRMTGFDVLAKIRSLARRPRIIVLSSRGREDDVTRAFQLGADDYVTKPFSPQELLVRVARLFR